MAGYEVIGSHEPDNLIGGNELPLLTKKVNIEGTAGTVKRGTVLGRITVDTQQGATAAAGDNTGDGTLVMDVTAPLQAGAQAGVYTVKIITKAAGGNDAVAEVRDPKGRLVGTTKAATSSGTVFSKQIKFTITDGSTAFEVGDSFTVTVAALFGNYKVVDKTANNGTAYADCVLSHDAKITAASCAEAIAYKTGIFNRGALIVATGDAIDGAHEVELREKGIHLRDEYPIEPPAED